MYKKASWIKDSLDGKVYSVLVVKDGKQSIIPKVEGNSDYKELMRQVEEEGLVIGEADNE